MIMYTREELAAKWAEKIGQIGREMRSWPAWARIVAANGLLAGRSWSQVKAGVEKLLEEEGNDATRNDRSSGC